MPIQTRTVRTLVLAAMTAGFLLAGSGAAQACHNGPFSFPFPSPFAEPPQDSGPALSD